jgi:uncharacterized protein with HEPN domain
MPPEDRVRLLHMVEALETVQRFVTGRTRGDLDVDDMFRLALTRAIEVVGEAASRITAGTQQDHPQVPWRALAGMRNRLIHAYFDVNRDIVWTTATDEVPDLLIQVHEILGGA